MEMGVTVWKDKITKMMEMGVTVWKNKITKKMMEMGVTV